MLKAALISLGSVSSQWTLEEMRKYFDVVDDISIKDLEVFIQPQGKGTKVLYKSKPLGEYDCIFCKGSYRYASLLRAICIIYKNKCYIPYDPSAFTIGHDKLLTHLKFQEHNVPMPRTYIPSNIKLAKSILETITYPIIMKFPQGTQGKGVMFADSFASASSILDALSTLRQPLIIQEFIDTGGVDTRAIVIGEKVYCAMQRRAVAGESRANIHAGGKGESCTLDKKTERVALMAAKSIGAEICAVDILPSAKGPVVIEINLSPGLQGITEATGKNVAGAIAKYLYENTKKFKENEKQNGTEAIMKDVGIETVIASNGKNGNNGNEYSDNSEKNDENKDNDKFNQDIITNIRLRGEKILLPEFVTELSELDEDDEVIINVDKGKIYVKKV